jgi:hypothetical protein
MPESKRSLWTRGHGLERMGMDVGPTSQQ